MDIARVDETLLVEYGKEFPLYHFSLFLPSIVYIGCFKRKITLGGVAITNGRKNTEFNNMGYADDTAVYLRDRSAIIPSITILDDLAYVSGLRINREKSKVIELDPRGSAQPVSTCGITM